MESVLAIAASTDGGYTGRARLFYNNAERGKIDQQDVRLMALLSRTNKKSSLMR
jgi:hypothetical protein